MGATSLFDVLYLLGAAQGVFVVALLWTRRQNRSANRWLAGAIAAISVSCAYVLYVRSGTFRSDPRWLFAIDTLPAVYGPLFYLYTLALTDRRRRPRAWMHLVPFALYSAYDIPRWLLPGPRKLALLEREQRHQAAWDQTLWGWGVELQGLAYFIAALWAVHEYRSLIAREYSTTERIDLRWLRALLTSLLALWIASACARISPVPILPYVHAGLTVIIYVIAYLNASQSQIFAGVLPIAGERRESPEPARTETAPSEDIALAKYQKTRLRDEQATHLALALRELFEREKPSAIPISPSRPSPRASTPRPITSPRCSTTASAAPSTTS